MPPASAIWGDRSCKVTFQTEINRTRNMGLMIVLLTAIGILQTKPTINHHASTIGLSPILSQNLS
jgi:hypothetical protein